MAAVLAADDPDLSQVLRGHDLEAQTERFDDLEQRCELGVAIRGQRLVQALWKARGLGNLGHPDGPRDLAESR